MKKYFLLIVLVLLLAACNETVTATPTATNISPVEIAGTMMQVQLAAEATQQAVQVQLSATAQIVGITSTSEAFAIQQAVTQQARQDAQATAEQHRLDIQATQQRIDADATQEQARRDLEATQVQTRLDVQSTQQAGSTATAGVMTMTAIPPAGTNTAIAVQQQILLANNQVQLSNLQVQQQSQKNTPEWVIPYFAALVAILAGGVYLYNHSRVREIKNDDGEIQLLVIDNKRSIRPQLLTGPVLDHDGAVSMPQLTSSAEQSKVTERAQAIDAISKMPTATTPQAAQTFNKYFGTQQQDLPFEIIDAEETPPAGLLDGETMKSLNKDWKEAKDGG